MKPMITLNKLAGECLQRFRERYCIKTGGGQQIFSSVLCVVWARMDQNLKDARDESRSEYQRNSLITDATERLADMIVCCVGMLRMLGVKDVEALISRRLGK